jgi:ADP-ribose pyrophosphatase YjhB (NUDIX family)
MFPAPGWRGAAQGLAPFRRRGRSPLGDNGRVTESESALPDYPVRLAGRVIAIDPAGRVLLFFYDNPPPKGKHWATPGGGVEEGEDFYAAAGRELAEETGWTDVPVEPGQVHQHDQVQFYGTGQHLVRQYDHYFAAYVTTEERPLGDVAAMHTADGIVRYHWWTLDELDATAEVVYPMELAELVRRLRR